MSLYDQILGGLYGQALGDAWCMSALLTPDQTWQRYGGWIDRIRSRAMQRFRGRTVLITGAGGAIGRAAGPTSTPPQSASASLSRGPFTRFWIVLCAIIPRR